MGLNLIVLLVGGGLASAGAWFLGRATGHEPLGRIAVMSLWGLLELGLAIDLVISDRRARARGVRSRRAGHVLSLSIVGAVLLGLGLVHVLVGQR